MDEHSLEIAKTVGDCSKCTEDDTKAAAFRSPNCIKQKTSASVELTQTRHSHSKQLFQGGQISVFLQGGSKSFIRCL